MGRRKCVLWLHTNPEHYFHCMMDDLARTSDYEYQVGYLWDMPASYVSEYPRPTVAPWRVLETKRPGMQWRKDWGVRYLTTLHKDWRAVLAAVGYDLLIMSGYLSHAGRTHREVVRDCKRRGIPVAIFSDSNLRGERGGGCWRRAKRCAKRAYLRPFVRDVDYFLPANRLGVAYWRYYGVNRERIVRCPYYADYGRIAAAAGVGRAEALGLEAGQKIILTAARLAAVKGLDLGIRAFLESGLAREGWVYAIAGRGDLEAELKALAGDELGKGVRFLGFVQPTQLLALVRHAQFFLFPSRYEPHGIVVQEAMAAGTPVLASDVVGAAYDLVKPGRSGWFFRSGDVEALRKTLREAAAAVGDEAGRARWGASTRAVFEAWFAETNPVMVTDRLAHRLLEGRG